MAHARDAGNPPDETALASIEVDAVRMARDVGQTLMQYFGTNLDVQYKDEKESDPVTNVDKEVQTDLVRAISEGYPGHGVVGEEDDNDEPAPDYVWVLDPLDGTKNFINGLPVFASSIGILHRGVPVAGAIYVPWPGSLDGLVVHARKCGGAYANDEPVTVLDGPEPEGNRLIALPASFSRALRFGAPMRGKAGERRVSGSIAYEMAMTARGVLQYSFWGAPYLWDVAAGAALMGEAGGSIMVAERCRSRLPLAAPGLRWSDLHSFFPDWSDQVTPARMRRWQAPLICGNPKVSRYVARNLNPRGWRLRARA